MMLVIMPLPDWAIAFRPEWVPLCLVYWTMAIPRKVGCGIGWLLGLFLDVVKGSLLGQHAIGLALVAYLSIRLHQRMRVFPVWQQAMTVGLILLPYLLIVLWVHGISGQNPDIKFFWGPLLTSVVLWPWVFMLLREIRRYAQITN